MLKLVAVGLVSFWSASGWPPLPAATAGPTARAAQGARNRPRRRRRARARGDLTKAYDLLRRLRADDSTVGRSEERIRDWTERATSLTATA